MVDLRFAAFVRISRDAGLRSLLVNHADRIDHDRGRCAVAAENCFLALRWLPDDRACAPVGSELLTAGVHLPRQRRGEHRFHDVVLERLHAALTTDPGDAPIRSRRLGTSPALVNGGADTIVKTGIFEVSPAGPLRAEATALRQLAVWNTRSHRRCHPCDVLGGTPSTN